MSHAGVRKRLCYRVCDFVYATLLPWVLQFSHINEEVGDDNSRGLCQLYNFLSLLLVVRNGAMKQFSFIESVNASPVSIFFFFNASRVSHWRLFLKGILPTVLNGSHFWSEAQLQFKFLMQYLYNKCCLLLVLPSSVKLFGDKLQEQREGDWGNWQKKRFIPVVYGLRKISSLETFPQVWVTLKDSWLSWEGRRGREQWSKWLCLFSSAEGTQSKASALTLGTALLSKHGLTVGLSLAFCSVSTFSDTLSHGEVWYAKYVLIIVFCFQRKWKANPLNVLE